MRLLHPDYSLLVMADYKKKLLNKSLSPLLAQSSPAKIRQECVTVYTERPDSRDDNMLRAFFGPGDSRRGLLQVIENFKTSRFKPLDNYLKGLTDKTDDRNLELLAWLIGFRHRPYVFGMEVILDEEELAVLGASAIDTTGNTGTAVPAEPDDDPVKEDPEENEPKHTEETEVEKLGIVPLLTAPQPEPEPKEKEKKKLKMKMSTANVLLSLFLVGVVYVLPLLDADTESGDTGCMYWTGTSYEQVPCQETRKDLFKLPMDADKMKSFKRIMKEDTITERSIGKVHYIKINGDIEFYTTGGKHPVDVTRNLHQLTSYMFNKYLSKHDTSGKARQSNYLQTLNL